MISQVLYGPQCISCTTQFNFKHEHYSEVMNTRVFTYTETHEQRIEAQLKITTARELSPGHDILVVWNVH